MSAIIEQQLISAENTIAPTLDEPVRAIDVVGCFAAVYRVSVDNDGGWFDDVTVARKAGPKRWVEVFRAGGRGPRWEAGWEPTKERLYGGVIAVFGSGATKLPDESDEMVLVRHTCGFVARTVQYLRVTSPGGARTRAVDSPAGAFVVVVLGDGPMELQGLDEAGNPHGPPLLRP